MTSLIKTINDNYEKVILVGDGATKYKKEFVKKLGDKAFFAPGTLNLTRASSVCRIGMVKLLRGQWDNIFSLAPEYLRDSQAQRMLKKKG